MSGGYEDDTDHGDNFDYTGQGGRDLQGDQLDQIMGKRLWDAPQSADQEWKLGNLALKISVATGKPVRVVRGANLKNSNYCPAEGYRYDGLYTVVDAWQEKGKADFLMCKFRFERVKGQPPIPLCGAPVAGPSRVPKGPQGKRPQGDTPVNKTKSGKGKRTATMEGITFKYEGS
jgi:E3 ubiquitin-protein ligase UHRF1